MRDCFAILRQLNDQKTNNELSWVTFTGKLMSVCVCQIVGHLSKTVNSRSCNELLVITDFRTSISAE